MDRKAVLAAGLLCLFGSVLYLNRDWPLCWEINQHGVRAEGWVIGKGEGKSGLVHYAYRGPRKVHTSSGPPGYGTPPFDDLHEGDPVVVYFLPDRPEVSFLGLPDARLLRQHSIMVWTLLGACALAGWTFRRELLRHAAR